MAQRTMRFGSTAKVLLKCKLKYYRISECNGTARHVQVKQRPGPACRRATAVQTTHHRSNQPSRSQLSSTARLRAARTAAARPATQHQRPSRSGPGGTLRCSSGVAWLQSRSRQTLQSLAARAKMIAPARMMQDSSNRANALCRHRAKMTIHRTSSMPTYPGYP